MARCWHFTHRGRKPQRRKARRKKVRLKAEPKKAIGIGIGLTAVLALYLLSSGSGWDRSPLPPDGGRDAQRLVPAPPKPSLTFSYRVLRRPGEGDPSHHPHTLMTLNGFNLFVLRDEAGYPSTVKRAQEANARLRHILQMSGPDRAVRFSVADQGEIRAHFEREEGGDQEMLVLALTQGDTVGNNRQQPCELVLAPLPQASKPRSVKQLWNPFRVRLPLPLFPGLALRSPWAVECNPSGVKEQEWPGDRQNLPVQQVSLTRKGTRPALSTRGKPHGGVLGSEGLTECLQPIIASSLRFKHLRPSQCLVFALVREFLPTFCPPLSRSIEVSELQKSSYVCRGGQIHFRSSVFQPSANWTFFADSLGDSLQSMQF